MMHTKSHEHAREEVKIEANRGELQFHVKQRTPKNETQLVEPCRSAQKPTAQDSVLLDTETVNTRQLVYFSASTQPSGAVQRLSPVVSWNQ